MCDGFCVCSKYFCTLRYIVRQRAYVIYDAIIYSKRPLLRLRPLPSNDELSAAKAHWCQSVSQSEEWFQTCFNCCWHDSVKPLQFLAQLAGLFIQARQNAVSVICEMPVADLTVHLRARYEYELYNMNRIGSKFGMHVDFDLPI